MVGENCRSRRARRAEFYYQQLDALRPLRQQVRHELLAEAQKHEAWKLLRQIPSDAISLSQQAAAMGLSEFAIETHSSADQQCVDGKLQRSKKKISVRGLNRNHHHDLKNLCKSAATVAADKLGSFQEFCDVLIAKGISPEMARRTLARKIAAIALTVWKKGVSFDAQYLNPQTA